MSARALVFLTSGRRSELSVKFDERALGGTSDESGEADGEKARGTQMGLPRVCTVRERAGMVVGLSSYG